MSDLIHTITSGQSLAIGGVGGGPLSTQSEQANAHRVQSDGSLAPLVAVTEQFPDVSMGYRLGEARTGSTLGFSTHGQGSKSIAELSPGGSTGRFEQAVDYIAAAYAATTGAYSVEAVHWIQGERDQEIGTTADAYLQAVADLKAAYDAAIEDETGEAADVWFITSQTASWPYYQTPASIGLAQLDAARTVPGMVIVGGQYQLPYVQFGLHLTNVGYYYLGELHARAHQALVNGRSWEPFAPIAYDVQPTYIDVQYHVPAPPLRFDTSTIPGQPGMGFSLSGTPSTITTAEIITPDTVRLHLSIPLVGNDVHVGYGVAASWNANGAGNLCDSETAVSSLDGTRLSNWALHSLDPIEAPPVDSTVFAVGSDLTPIPATLAFVSSTLDLRPVTIT